MKILVDGAHFRECLTSLVKEIPLCKTFCCSHPLSALYLRHNFPKEIHKVLTDVLCEFKVISVEGEGRAIVYYKATPTTYKDLSPYKDGEFDQTLVFPIMEAMQRAYSEPKVRTLRPRTKVFFMYKNELVQGKTVYQHRVGDGPCTIDYDNVYTKTEVFHVTIEGLFRKVRENHVRKQSGS